MSALIIICFLAGCKSLSPTETSPRSAILDQVSAGTSPEPVSTSHNSSTPTGEITPEPDQVTEIPPSSIPVIVAASTASPQTEIQPFVPVLGGADRIAFFDQNEIWMVNLDGNQLTRLTNDGIPKGSPQWHPISGRLYFITGDCINYLDSEQTSVESLVCFDHNQHLTSFQISPDGNQIAIILDGELYVLPFDPIRVSQVRTAGDLAELGSCAALSPYRHRQSLVVVRRAYWSKDGRRLAILREAYEHDQDVELVQILDISRCTSPIPRLDEFPATRFEMENYYRTPILQDFTWDGSDLFAVTDFKRNDGFGDLWIYSSFLHQGFKANPIEGKCCYRDPVFSPDGKYIAFAYQDASLGADGPLILYFIPYAALDTSFVFPPLPLPGEFFSEPHAKPQPVFHAAP
jgi:hypothetical protein